MKWETGSLSAFNIRRFRGFSFIWRGLKKQYRENSKIKFRLIGRPLYIEKLFQLGYMVTIQKFANWKYILSSKDPFTEDVIFYGNGSKISCDSVGNI